MSVTYLVETTADELFCHRRIIEHERSLVSKLFLFIKNNIEQLLSCKIAWNIFWYLADEAVSNK